MNMFRLKTAPLGPPPTSPFAAPCVSAGRVEYSNIIWSLDFGAIPIQSACRQLLLFFPLYCPFYGSCRTIPEALFFLQSGVINPYLWSSGEKEAFVSSGRKEKMEMPFSLERTKTTRRQHIFSRIICVPLISKGGKAEGEMRFQVTKKNVFWRCAERTKWGNNVFLKCMLMAHMRYGVQLWKTTFTPTSHTCFLH